MATENQYFNKFAYKPYVDYQYCQQQSYTSGSNSTEGTSPMVITQQTNYATVNNDLASSVSSSSSSLLSSYPLVSSSTWQNSYPTDYLGLPTFDQHQQPSPTVSVLSSLSPSSASSSCDMMVYAADDFCVSDLMDSQSQQSHILSPMFNNTTTNDHYYAQQQQQPMQQQPSPRSEYWISPATPLMESMDGYMTNGMDQQQQQQSGCLFIKQEDEGSIFVSTTTSPFNIEMTITDNNNNKPTSLSSSSSSSTTTILGPIKKKSKKIHHCPHCNHTSNRANNMKEHILTHDPHRPKLFACNTCQKSFARKHDMKRHAKSHFKVPRRQSKSTQKQQKV